MDGMETPRPETNKATAANAGNTAGGFYSSFESPHAIQAENNAGQSANTPLNVSAVTPEGGARKHPSMSRLAADLAYVREAFGLHDNNLGDIATTGRPRGPLRVMNPDPSPMPSGNGASESHRVASRFNVNELQQHGRRRADASHVRRTPADRRYIQGALHAMQYASPSRIHPIRHPQHRHYIASPPYSLAPGPQPSRYRRYPMNLPYRQPLPAPLPRIGSAYPQYQPYQHGLRGAHQSPSSLMQLPPGFQQRNEHDHFGSAMHPMGHYLGPRTEPLKGEEPETHEQCVAVRNQRIWDWLNSIAPGAPTINISARRDNLRQPVGVSSSKACEGSLINKTSQQHGQFIRFHFPLKIDIDFMRMGCFSKQKSKGWSEVEVEVEDLKLMSLLGICARMISV
ncbi:hypothetical protein PRK78_000402 [Emydomyces testavorans]|uniref:Uncharacterized protein n=1 Tax=Emydomyces testavorans TaxID=2070801 RepID=A0AAF0DB43_9EURO|nr:hypothetical protein PRK78_000402 [Emydomyces testavorans]